MGYNHKHIPKAANSLQDECIRVQKVYDWVTDSLTVRKSVAFSPEQIKKIEKAMDDPCRRPLRIVTKVPKTPPVFPLSESEPGKKHTAHFLCEQVGEKRNVTVSLNGGFADAQLVDLLFTTDVKVQVVDRTGEVVTELIVNASVFESFVLCYPDGTDLFCRITKIFSRIPSGTVLLNNPAPMSFDIEITFCVDIQVEAEVKLEVLAKFCSPRENDLVAPEDVNMCPPITFPQQCPDIYPRPNCDCSAKGEASGLTGNNATESGRLAILVDICPNCSITNSTFRLSFNDTNTSDGQKDFNFTATSFDQDTLCCEPCQNGLKLTVSGGGRASSNGESYDFNLAIVQSDGRNQFQVQLIDGEGVTVFESGIVSADSGDIELEDCVTFEDIKFKHQP
ncbi:hypothetical protein ACFQPF_09105 [Fictibacillus iocasae]|uniref:Uncharacterized protein n=1 Tax=Fictibacillus iocasae TaxID=2715437 RepID=A0ABW2NR67_9BACL